MVTDPPAALRVTVDLARSGVHADADRTDQRRLTDVRSESGPEAVEGAGLVHRARVYRQPVAHDIKMDHDEYHADAERRAENPKAKPLHLAGLQELVRSRHLGMDVDRL